MVGEGRIRGGRGVRRVCEGCKTGVQEDWWYIVAATCIYTVFKIQLLSHQTFLFHTQMVGEGGIWEGCNKCGTKELLYAILSVSDYVLHLSFLASQYIAHLHYCMCLYV